MCLDGKLSQRLLLGSSGDGMRKLGIFEQVRHRNRECFGAVRLNQETGLAMTNDFTMAEVAPLFRTVWRPG